MALLDADERASLRAAQAGSSAGFESLFRSTWPRAFRASYLVVLDHAAAEEIVLECFLGAVRTLDGFDREGPFAPWLHRAVVTRSIDRARARALQPSGFRGDLDESTAPLEWAMPIGGPHLDPAALALAGGLYSLSPDLRAALVLRYLLDYGAGEAAELLEVPRETLSARLDRARAHLQTRLEGEARLDEKTLRTLLLQQPVPGEQLALDRTWEIVASAYGTREPTARRRRVPLRALGAVLALAAIGVAVWLSPAGSWIAERFEAGDEGTQPAPETVAAVPAASLPAPGRVLVVGGGELSVLDPSGARAPLGSYIGASWAPSGRFVAAWRKGLLVGLDVSEPDTLLWQVERRGIADARWSEDGFRVTYRSGRALRVVDGSGSDDRRLARGVAPVAPAWRPGAEHVLAFADSRGRVRVVDADTGEGIWRAPAGDVVALDWLSPERLAVLTAAEVFVLQPPGARVHSQALGSGVAGTALARRPGADELAYAVFDRATRTSSVFLLDLATGQSRLLFAGTGRLATLVWAPDGSRLLVPWRQAGQWLFFPSRRGELVSLAAADGTLGPGAFPRPTGWCCAAAVQ